MVDIEERSKLLTFAATASVITAVTLIVVKLGAWYFTNSVSIMASLIDSLMDAGASVINYLAIRYALVPADEEHRFGHGKAEPLAGLSQSAFICGSVVFLFFNAIERFIHPTPVTNFGVGVGVMVFSILATAMLLMIQRYVIKKTQSTAIEADSLHYLSDLLTNLAIVASLVFAAYGVSNVDPAIAILVGLYIALSAIAIGKKAINMLMDHELAIEEREAIFEQVLKNQKVLAVHDLRTRQSGHTIFVQFHIELDDNMPLIEAHDVADEVEADFRKTFPHMDVIIHQDPLSVVKLDKIRERRTNPNR